MTHADGSNRGRWSVGAALAAAGMAVAGLVTGALIGIAILFITFNGDEHPEGAGPRFDIMLFAVVLLLVPTVLLWRTGRRMWRAFALGLGGVWLLSVLISV